MTAPTKPTGALSRSKAERLGKLWAKDEATVEQMAEVRGHIEAHLGPMQSVRQRLGGLGLQSSSRLKTETTLKQKLAKSTALGNVQDIAGVRVVEDMTVDQQDVLVALVREQWPDAKVIDRRAEPSSGYRGVHMVVEEDGMKVEIQVRTQLRHDWAQAMERLADGWGRQIRYGGEPDRPDAMVGKHTRREIVASLVELGEGMDVYERAQAEALRTGKDASAELSDMARNCMSTLSMAHEGLRQLQIEGRGLAMGERSNARASTGTEVMR